MGVAKVSTEPCPCLLLDLLGLHAVLLQVFSVMMWGWLMSTRLLTKQKTFL